MEAIEKSETLLAKWVSGEMTKEELKEFEKSEDYNLFVRITEEATLFKRPKFNKEEVFSKIVNEISENKKVISLKADKKSKVFRLKNTMSIAATLLLLVSTFYFLNFNTEVNTGFGERRTIVLPDNSTVILNAKSSLSYNKKNWKQDRTLELEGEAYFKVAKGSKFQVKTTEGTISVLGTQFTVFEEEGFLTVTCFEGKVKVERKDVVVILTKGKTFSQYKDAVPLKMATKKVNPDWLKQESSFVSAPLLVVLKSIEKQYHIKMINLELKKDELYTGSFVHTNLEQALEAVLLPMNISYTVSYNKKIVTLK
ncbi:FecR family protein [Polaribacter sp. PL03]|uniref:FecR family protein n=1 Tax=Polaribacter sp. PL03 TaxID=3088353 RepID=UPI0029CD43B1|nr:FecR family protein [Polaribacter sp. PL03]MDX6746787.1 FecR family protein [Polaribacter sp. PL03]